MPPCRTQRLGPALLALASLLASHLARPVDVRGHVSSSPTAIHPDSLAAGRTLYREACATCHGMDGRGAPRSTVAFEDPLPDFAACSFASREPDQDWLAVSHDGGPARGFAATMPAFGDALTDREMHLVLAYVRSLCGDDAWPRGELNLPRPLVTEKAYPEDEAVLTLSSPLEGSGAVMNEVVWEKRIGSRSQVEVVIPFGWRELASDPAAPDATRWVGGVGDVALGVKRDLYHSLASGTIVSVGGEVVVPTGDEEDGFGKGTTVFEPFVSLGRLLPWDGFIHLQGIAELPADGDVAEEEVLWRGALGRTFTHGRFGRSWSPMVEVLGRREMSGGAEAEWDLLPQLQVTLNTRQNIMFDVGVRLPLTDADARDAELLIYFLWDWFDGGLLEGW